MASLAAPYGIAPSAARPADKRLRQRALVTAKLRALAILLIFVMLALAALLRIALIGLLDPAPDARSMAERLLPPRAGITDRNGLPLASQLPSYALWFNPEAFGDSNPLVKTPEEIAGALAQIVPGSNYGEMLARLQGRSKGYLIRRLMPEEANKVLALGEPALEFPRESDRFYPQATLAAHVLGYVDPDGGGQVGMEQVLNARLIDHDHRGEPVALAMDMRVQGALEEELGRTMAETNAKGAMGVVLDVDTGEVVALASLPAFNPNRADLATNALVFNRATNQVYELGSVIKPLSIAAAIDAGVVTDLAQRYFAGAPLKLDGYTIHDTHTYGTWLNVPEALVHSSNIVTAQVADKLGAPRLNATMRALGFADRAEIELPAKGFPIWPKGNWSRITNMTVSYGHGMAISPLHLAAAYAAMVNGGIWRKSTLMKLAPGQAMPGRRVFKAATSARMRQLLRMIVKVGTGRHADAAGFRVGGKTGSAEKPGHHGYQKTALISTFAAAFPMDRPRYVVVASLDEPQATAAASGQRTAAWNAAYVAGRVIPRIGPMLGIVPDITRDVDITDVAPLVGNGEGE